MSQSDFRDEIAKYAVFLGRRNTYRQKSALLLALKPDFEKAGYPVKGISDKVRFSKAINIQIGDVEHAKTLVVAHYDQPNRVFFSKGEYDPFSDKNHLIPQLFSENIVQLAVLVFALIGLTLINSIGNIWFTILFIILFTAVLLYTFIHFPKGLKNRYNFNKNNSSLLAMLEYARKYPGKKNIAFVLTDNECLNHHGDVMIDKMLGEKLKSINVVHLDSVGKGTTLQVACNGENAVFAEAAIRSYKGPLKTFKRVIPGETADRTSLRLYPKAISASVGELVNDGFVITGPQTPKDIDIDETLILDIAEWIENLRNQ
jgi:hypothetical protein